MSLGQVFLSEVLGTAILIVLGVGVVANVLLPKNGGFGGGPLMINIGWGFAVFSGVNMRACWPTLPRRGLPLPTGVPGTVKRSGLMLRSSAPRSR